MMGVIIMLSVHSATSLVNTNDDSTGDFELSDYIPASCPSMLIASLVALRFRPARSCPEADSIYTNNALMTKARGTSTAGGKRHRQHLQAACGDLL
ncbi:MAG: hypothetical protein LBF37_02875 [Rickettsiales bacterium]|jgi:hypothetical protein|nr:hypothetical protein [Rickettsiales bacterium]